MDIAITHRCNLRCSTCYHFESDGDVGKNLPAEEGLQFFEELNRIREFHKEATDVPEDVQQPIDEFLRSLEMQGLVGYEIQTASQAVG